MITTKPADEPGPLAQSAWNIFKDLPTFDIRNGDMSDVRTVFIKATVPQMYHWVPVEGVQAEDTLKTLDGYIVSHMHQVSAHGPPHWSAEKKRKITIIMGTPSSNDRILPHLRRRPHPWREGCRLSQCKDI